MKMKFRKNWWIWLIVGVLCCAMLGGIIYAIVAATENKENTVEISASEFSLGGLDNNGKYVETKESIYTKDAFQCQGLTVTPEFESQVTYQIFFYDELGEFISKTNSLEKAYRDGIPAGVSHARIVITPNKIEGEAVKLNVFKVSKYAKQLTIKVNKEQKTFIEQLAGADNHAVLLGQGSYDMTKKSFTAGTSMPWYWFAPVDVSDVNTVCIKLKTTSATGTVTFNEKEYPATCYYFDSSSATTYNLYEAVAIATENDFSYFMIDVSDVNEFMICTHEASSQVLEIYLI